jgi:hypothetical protein
MSIACRGCGRSYPVERFAYGRTFHCGCGAHVVGPIAVRDLPVDEPPRFLADAMLCGLARWLRILGFDASQDDHIKDAELVRRAVVEHRLLLTRDRGLVLEWRIDGILTLESDKPLEQLTEVDRQRPLARFARLFTRGGFCRTRAGGRAQQRRTCGVLPRLWAGLLAGIAHGSHATHSARGRRVSRCLR